jgi:hypothetical protein
MSEPCSQMRAYQNPTGTTPCPTQCTSTMYPLLAPSITSCLRKHGAGTNQTSQGSAFLVPEHSCISLISFTANWGPNLSYACSSDSPTNARPTTWSTTKPVIFWSPAMLYSMRGAQNNTTSDLSLSTMAWTLPHPCHQAPHHTLHPLLPLHLLLSQRSRSSITTTTITTSTITTSTPKAHHSHADPQCRSTVFCHIICHAIEHRRACECGTSDLQTYAEAMACQDTAE